MEGRHPARYAMKTLDRLLSLVERQRFLATVVLAIAAGALSEILQRWLVEPRLAGELTVLVDLSPLYPIIVAALLAGCYSHSPLDGLAHSAVLAAADMIVGVLASGLLGYEYAQDVSVGDPGFLQFVGIQFLVLLFFVALLVEATFLARWLVHRLRGGRPAAG